MENFKRKKKSPVTKPTLCEREWEDRAGNTELLN